MCFCCCCWLVGWLVDSLVGFVGYLVLFFWKLIVLHFFCLPCTLPESSLFTHSREKHKTNLFKCLLSNRGDFVLLYIITLDAIV